MKLFDWLLQRGKEATCSHVFSGKDMQCRDEDCGGEYWKPPIGTSMLPLMRENAQLRAQLISIAYVDEVPQVQQGEPNHEVLELLDAETVRGFITTIERLTRERDAARNSDEHNFNRWQRDHEQLATVTRERDALVSAIDNEMVVSHIGIFSLSDDPRDKSDCHGPDWTERDKEHLK